MKTLHIIIMGVLIPMFILGNTGGGGVSWFSAPKEEPNGWYWMYDDAEPGPPFDDPALVPLPTFADITGDGNKLAPYNNDPFEYQLPDSFWYYGHWYDENDYLYISPDGWVSFDPDAEVGYPDPPAASPPFPVTDVPNAVIAPLWQDMNPTQGGDPDNRVYYKYTAMPAELIVQWYQTQGHGNTNTYDFELRLSTGGQIMLMTEGACGVVFSYHFIHFLYNNASPGWTADNGKTGIEDYTGEHGIYYQGTLADGRVIRAGYKRIFKNDVMVTRFLSPGRTVLRWTEIEPKVEVANVGEETEHFSVTIDIYDETDGELVYHQNISSFNLAPGEYDTLVCPCWTPGELTAPDIHSYLKVAYTMLGRDLCKHNDTLTDVSIVHCDGWLAPYHWNPADWPIAAAVYRSRLGTSYDISGGTYVLGGRVFIGWRDGSVYPTPPRIEVWQAQNGCGGVPNGSTALGGGNYDGFAEPLKWHEVIFERPIWCPTGDPGNFWIAVCHPTDAGGTYMGWVPDWSLFRPDPSACYNMDYDPSRSGYWYAPTGGPSSDFNWGGYPDAPHHTHPIEALTHLGFSPMPAPPCYYDVAHDLTCYRMEDPSGDYVEADVVITPKLAIANTGLEAEPDPGDFFAVEFIVVDKETSDTVFHETSLLSSTLDMGDTLYGTTAPWTPEGLCDKEEPFVSYELIGLVRLGEVGPDLSDHCPYNDTVRHSVTCLFSHDVGVIDMTWPEPPDEPPDWYDEGSQITVTATVENFGFHAEHDVHVRLEIRDLDDNNVELWHALKNIDFLDWRGNESGNPYTVDVTFPTYVVQTDRRFYMLCCTELEDDCPDDDCEVRSCPPGIVEEAEAFPGCFTLEIPGSTISARCQVKFAVPHSSLVRVEIFDVNGRWVCSLKNDIFEQGRYSCSWNGRDGAGRKVAAGIYLVRMEADEFKAVRKVVIIN